MRLHALLSFYDERPSMLRACVAGLGRVGIDRLIAVDGAYRLLPGGKPESPRSQWRALEKACARHNIALSGFTPGRVWHGNCVEKRDFMFGVAWDNSLAGDWWLVIDADEVVTAAPSDIRARLEATELDVATVTLIEDRAYDAPNHLAQLGERHSFPSRRWYRAQPIHVGPNHYTYTTEDGRKLWGDGELAPSLPLVEMTVDHRVTERDPRRDADKYAYYAARDAEGSERGLCARCDDPATEKVPCDWRRGPDGRPIADFIEVCAKHRRRVAYENDFTLRALGVDPSSVRVMHRQGPAPV